MFRSTSVNGCLYLTHSDEIYDLARKHWEEWYNFYMQVKLQADLNELTTGHRPSTSLLRVAEKILYCIRMTLKHSYEQQVHMRTCMEELSLIS